MNTFCEDLFIHNGGIGSGVKVWVKWGIGAGVNVWVKGGTSTRVEEWVKERISTRVEDWVKGGISTRARVKGISADKVISCRYNFYWFKFTCLL